MDLSQESRYLDADRMFAPAHTYSAKRKVDLDTAGEPVLESRDTLYLLTVVDDADTTPDEVMATVTDRFDLLAHQWLGEPERWWRIADANPQIRYPLDLKMGDTVVIPE